MKTNFWHFISGILVILAVIASMPYLAESARKFILGG